MFYGFEETSIPIRISSLVPHPCHLLFWSETPKGIIVLSLNIVIHQFLIGNEKNVEDGSNDEFQMKLANPYLMTKIHLSKSFLAKNLICLENDILTRKA